MIDRLHQFFSISAGDDNKRFSSLEGTSANSNNNRLATDAKSNTTSSGFPKTQKIHGNKIRKPIDLGAAASFAASAQAQSTQSKSNKSTTSNFDLFSTADYGHSTVTSQPQPSSLVITGNDDDDDFDPRGLSRYVELFPNPFTIFRFNPEVLGWLSP